MIYGWDLGGAHVKRVILDAQGRVRSVTQVPCALWQGLDHLQSAVQKLLLPSSGTIRHAVTMTGELVDLFPNRAEGVAEILRVFAENTTGSKVCVFDGAGFVNVEDAVSRWHNVASANWRASAKLVALQLNDALVLDIGSTTTDITLISDGRIVDGGNDDQTRLAHETLLYTGVVRTPLMAIASRVPFDGAWVGVMAECFATTGDIYRIIGRLPAAFDHADTADGKPKHEMASMRRVARMIGCDFEKFPRYAWSQLAKWYASRQADTIRLACDRQLSLDTQGHVDTLVGMGAGAFLARDIAQQLNMRYLDFAETHASADAVSPDDWMAIDVCAPAFAVAQLLHQEPR